MDPFFDAICYLIFVGGFQAVLIFLFGLALGIIQVFYPKLAIRGAFVSFVLFNLWLFIFGIIGNFLWYATAPGWLYINHDPVVEWIPFIIPGDWTIDVICGGSLTPGTKWVHMYLCWFCIALPVWILTIISYRRTKKAHFFQNPSRLLRGGAIAAFCILLPTLVFFFYRWGFTPVSSYSVTSTNSNDNIYTQH